MSQETACDIRRSVHLARRRRSSSRCAFGRPSKASLCRRVRSASWLTTPMCNRQVHWDPHADNASASSTTPTHHRNSPCLKGAPSAAMVPVDTVMHFITSCQTSLPFCFAVEATHQLPHHLWLLRRFVVGQSECPHQVTRDHVVQNAHPLFSTDLAAKLHMVFGTESCLANAEPRVTPATINSNRGTGRRGPQLVVLLQGAGNHPFCEPLIQ